MFKSNSYFDGNVVSIGFNGIEGEATIGVMAPGKYEFSTSKKEYMKVISGTMKVMLPGETEYKLYSRDEIFTIDANLKFSVITDIETAYMCLYK
jgi:uncharacterized protein YaiE (UPF0345 family)